MGGGWGMDESAEMNYSDQRCVVVTNYNNRHTSRLGHMPMGKRGVGVDGEEPGEWCGRVPITRECATHGGVHKVTAPEVVTEWWWARWRRGPT